MCEAPCIVYIVATAAAAASEEVECVENGRYIIRHVGGGGDISC